MARFSTLQDWLNWQEGLHPDPVDLGLDRVGRVAARLGCDIAGIPVITVAGTNGKGSSVAMLDAIYRAAGYHAGVYTSPHLLSYNERIRIDGRPVDDAALCEAFARIDAARGDVSLTYFEFGTLAALEIFRDRAPDVIVLEVGMGGRLDAVNIVDADVALVTAIGIDHSQWLGHDREAIGREKAGIFRGGRPAVCSDRDAPASVAQAAAKAGADWRLLGEHFDYDVVVDAWSWQAGDRRLAALPLPALAGAHQLENAAGVLMAVECLQQRCPVDRAAIDAGLRSVTLAGRCEVVPGEVERVLDVAHNHESAVRLAGFLADHPVDGQTWLVLGMLSDKDVHAFAETLSPHVDNWCLATLDDPRGLAACELRARAGDRPVTKEFPSIVDALAYAQSRSGRGDRIVVTGSFLSVASAMACRL